MPEPASARPLNGADSAQPVCSEAERAWQGIKHYQYRSADNLQAAYPECVQAIFAQARMDDLKIAAVAPPVAPREPAAPRPIVVVPPVHTPGPTPAGRSHDRRSTIGIGSRWAKGGACGARGSTYSLTIGGGSVTWHSGSGNIDIESVVSSGESEFRTRTTSSPSVKIGQLWIYTRMASNQMI